MIGFGRQLMSTILALTAFLLFLPLSGCGFKDNPVPPQQIVPKAVTDLQYQLDEKGVTLFWSYPRETVTGGEVSDIAGFELYRAVVPVDSYCQTCPLPFAEPISLPGGAVPPGNNKTATYEATVLRPGNLYFFKVRSKTGWWAKSQDSNVVSFLWQTPPMAPEGLNAVAGDSKNTLKWNPVSRYQDATPMTTPVRYQLYRSVDGGVFAKIGESLSSTGYTDDTVENGRTYSYQVQAINTYAQGTVSGAMSTSVNATPQDRTPPPVPQGVQGVRTEVGIKIFWDHVEASDLAGYRVYRRVEGEAHPKFVGEVNLPYNIFIDAAAPQNVPVFYSVSSIDMQKPANESTKSAEVSVTN